MSENTTESDIDRSAAGDEGHASSSVDHASPDLGAAAEPDLDAIATTFDEIEGALRRLDEGTYFPPDEHVVPDTDQIRDRSDVTDPTDDRPAI